MNEGDQRARQKQYRHYLDTELDAAAIYSVLAKADSDKTRAEVFEKLVEAEMRHARRWAEKLGIDPVGLKPHGPALKILLIRLVVRLFGTGRIVPILLRTEANEISAYAADPEARDLVPEERQHARILKGMGGPPHLTDAPRPPQASVLGSSGGVRAAVLGVNDGLVSNFSLVMGVAGGTDNNPDFILLAGVAGLLAGAFSMAAGEYVSMRSQRDIYENDIRKEEIELSEWPEEEEEELALIYQAKGLSPQESQRIARQLMADPAVALDTMAREELGLDPAQLGSPWGASASSFVAFVAGASVPILPYVFSEGDLSLTLSAALSAVALASVGGLIGLLSGKNVGWGALRMLLAGSAAAAVTFGVGSLINVSIL